MALGIVRTGIAASCCCTHRALGHLSVGPFIEYSALGDVLGPWPRALQLTAIPMHNTILLVCVFPRFPFEVGHVNPCPQCR
eukprot:scaffold72937_cov38-Tisochrysis_lutea.AAC.2